MKKRPKTKYGFHLLKPMGVVANSIENDAYSGDELYEKAIEFKAQRNWLAHDFDEESAPFVSQNKKLNYYIEKMEQIVNQANRLMVESNEVGVNLVPVGI